MQVGGLHKGPMRECGRDAAVREWGEGDDPHRGDVLWIPPETSTVFARFVPRLALVGTEAGTTTTLLAALTRRCAASGVSPLVIVATDTHTDDVCLRQDLAGVVDGTHVVGVSGAHDPLNEAATTLLGATAGELLARFSEASALFLGIASRDMPLPVDPALAHYTVAAIPSGDAVRRQSACADVIVVATDKPAPPPPTVNAAGVPVLTVNATTGAGLDDLFALLWADALLRD